MGHDGAHVSLCEKLKMSSYLFGINLLFDTRPHSMMSPMSTTAILCSCNSSSRIPTGINSVIFNTENTQAVDNPSPYSEPPSRLRKTAVLLIDNSGTVKSTLLSQLGSKEFVSGASLRTGVTKVARKEEIQIGGQRLVLIDVPGLYEPDESETQQMPTSSPRPCPKTASYTNCTLS